MNTSTSTRPSRIEFDDATSDLQSTSRNKVLWRGYSVAAITAITTVSWTVLSSVLDGSIMAPSFDGGPTTEVEASHVAISTLIAALVAWAALTIFERIFAKGVTIWRALGVGVAVLSLAGPFSGTGVTTSDRLVLATAHLFVAAAVILVLPRNASNAGRDHG